MFQSISSYLKHIPQLVGVELLLDEGESFTANLAVVKRAGTKVHFVNGEYGLTSLESLSRHIPRAAPVVLVISGKGVIHRALMDINDSDALKKVLPNARADDFYIQKVELEGAAFLSVARRKLVDDLVTRIEGQGITLLSIGLGPFAVTLFSVYLFGADRDSRSIGRHKFTLQAGKLTGYELQADRAHTTGGLDVAGEQLNEQLVVAFAAAFSSISEISDVQLSIPLLQTRAETHRQRWMFKRCGVALIAFFFALLLVNSGLFMHYSSRMSDEQGNDLQAVQREIDTLRKQASDRETLLGGMSYVDASQWGMAYLADRLAGTVPDGILLSELSVYPRDVAMSRKQGRPVHTPSMIHIKGTCIDMPLLNDWIKRIRSLSFCQLVKIDRYQFDEREGVGIFGLSLTLRP